jgi:hypothetical protein
MFLAIQLLGFGATFAVTQTIGTSGGILPVDARH